MYIYEFLYIFPRLVLLYCSLHEVTSEGIVRRMRMAEETVE